MADHGNQPGCDLVVVAPRTCQVALLQELGLTTGQTAIGYDNAYEAMAAVAVALRSCGVVTVVAMVDHLDRQEMEIFSCLAGEKAVKTIALSRQQRESKLAWAIHLGAHEAVMSLKDSVIIHQLATSEMDDLILPETGNLEATRLVFEKTSVLKDAQMESDLIENTIMESIEQSTLSEQLRRETTARRRPPTASVAGPTEPVAAPKRNMTMDDKIDLTAEELDALLGKDSDEA